MKRIQLKVPSLLWRRLIQQLCRRGGMERESGAFLLGTPGSTRISRFVCYDDLDDSALDTGIITFQAVGFVKLWEICATEKLKVMADVHTHPSAWTGQSNSDQTHPMIALSGHIAIILPDLVRYSKSSLNGSGIYECLGNLEWKTWSVKSGRVKIKLYENRNAAQRKHAKPPGKDHYDKTFGGLRRGDRNSWKISIKPHM